MKKYNFSSIKAYNVDATKLVSQLTKEDCRSLNNTEIMGKLKIKDDLFSYNTITQYLPTNTDRIPIQQIKKNIIKNMINGIIYFVI